MAPKCRIGGHSQTSGLGIEVFSGVIKSHGGQNTVDDEFFFIEEAKERCCSGSAEVGR